MGKHRKDLKIGDVTNCRECSREYPFTDEFFMKNTYSKLGLQYICINCHRVKALEIAQHYRESEKQIPDFKYCPGCKTTLPASKFSKCINVLDGLHSYCMSCNNARGRTRKLKMDLLGTHSTIQEEILWKEVGGICWGCTKYCPKKYDTSRGIKWGWTADHVIPYKRGGSNDINNIQILCNTCNSLKNHVNDWDFRAGKEYAYEQARRAGPGVR